MNMKTMLLLVIVAVAVGAAIMYSIMREPARAKNGPPPAERVSTPILRSE